MADSVPDAISDADKIRNKRLAKLGAQAHSTSNSIAGASGSSVAAPQATTQPSVDSANGSENQDDPSAKIHLANNPPPQETPDPSSNPFSQLGMRLSNGAAPRINISPARGGTVTLQKRERGELEPSKPSSRPEETLNEWEDRILGAIFRLTLDPKVRHDIHGHPLYYVASIKDELEEVRYPVRLGTAILDSAILEAASNAGKTPPLDYLLACWKRVTRLLRTLKPGDESDPYSQFGIASEAKRMCMSYCIFAVAMPEMFGREPTAINPLTPHLLVEQEDDRGLCHEFFTEAIARFKYDDITQEALVGAIEDLSRELAKMSMNDNHKPYVLAFRTIVRYPALVNALIQSPLFLPPSVPPGTLEVATLLGPFFQISPLQGEVTIQYFSSPKTRDKDYIFNSQRALRMTLQTHQADLLDIVNHIVRTGKEARDKMLDWFALCVNSNHKRRAMQVDQKLVSSDGFMINVTVCLDQLCEPFMDATFSKIDRIDVDYLRRKPRVDIREETKLNADQNASDHFYNETIEGTSGFISEVFFLTLAAHHYGSEAASSKLDQLEKDLKRMEKSVAEIELERHKFLSNPRQLQVFEDAVRKYKDQIDKGLSYKYAVQGVLLDDLTQTRSMQFLRYVIVWLLRLVTPGHDFPKRPLQLPLPDQQPDVFKCLPEYFLEDVVGNFKFIMRNMPHIITSTQSDELIMLCITFLRSSEYIKNPYLKSGLVTILAHGIWPTPHRAKGVLGDLLNSLPIATDHLLHALMKFYIEVENTGAHTQFYDKFNIRYGIFQVIKCIWSNPIYREHLSEEAKVNLDFFVRFVNLLLNDVTFVLDESLSAFVEIHNLQQELTTASSFMEAQVRTDKEEALAIAKEKAKNYMQLTNETVAMLKLFTEALADSFTMPEIVQRLADMLDYNLDVMVGSKNTSLNVENRQDYGFNPRALLAEIVDVYLNLRDKENFVFAVARDGRSYKPGNFEKATALMIKHTLKSPQDVAAWTALGEKFKRAKEVDDQAEEDLGEVPDEFLDPLMFTLMEDPVILPTSRTSLDRSTIRSHLLSDPNDPFNRAPLKIEDVIPDTELRARIQAFKAEKKGKKIADAAVMEEVMDTTAG